MTGVTITDDHVTDITCASTMLAPAGRPGDSTTCTGTFTITKKVAKGNVQKDVDRYGKKDGGHEPEVVIIEVTNTAVAHADNGLRSGPTTATIKVLVHKHKGEHNHCHKHHKQVHKVPCGPIESGDGSLATSFVTGLRAS